jgi:peptide/nickel transport system substrate-binding protein
MTLRRLALMSVVAAGLAAPASAQTLTIIRNIDAPHYDGVRTTAGATGEVLFHTGDTLVALDYDLKTIRPSLASSWEISPDGTTYTFKLRDDVTFCSGKKMTADDVVYTFQRVLNKETRAPFAWRMGPGISVTAKDATTVEYKMSAPFSELLLNLTNFHGTIISKDSVEALGKDYGVKGMDLTGPYCFQSWEPRNQTVATRNEAYRWGPPVYQNRGPAKFQRIVWRIVPEEAARLATMASGQGDMTYTMPDQYLPQLGRMPNMQIHRPEADLQLFYLGFKTTRPNVSDVRVRTALSIAINRQQIVDSIYFGNGIPAETYIHPKAPDYDPNTPKHLGRYDPAEAGRLLDEAGWRMGNDGFRYKDGQKLSLLLYGFAGGRSPKIAEAAQGFWRRIGVDLQLQMWDGTIVFSKLAQQDYDLWSISFPYSSAGDALRLYFHSSNMPAPNRMNWNDPITDAALDRGISALDDVTRVRAFAEVQTIVHNNALWVPLVHQGLALVSNKRIKNVRAHHVYGSLTYKGLDYAP